MDRFKLIAILPAKFHERRHIDLIKCGQHGRLLSGPQESLGDPRTHSRHGYAFFHSLTCRPVDINLRGLSGRCCRRLSNCCLLDVRQHILFEQSASLSSGCDTFRGQPVLIEKRPHRGTHWHSLRRCIPGRRIRRHRALIRLGYRRLIIGF